MRGEIHQLRPRPAATNWMCSACGVDAGCNCGAPLMSKSLRAAEAIAANPNRSDRDIAQEIGVGSNTVRRAREPAPDGAPERRIGRDGKSYPAFRAGDDDEGDHEEGLRVIAARGFLNRAAEAKEIATFDKLRASDVTEAMIKAADDAAAAWMTAAHNLRGMIQHG